MTPFPPQIRDILATDQDGPVEVRGWVRTVRDTKAAVFAEVNDGSSQRNLQAVFERERWSAQDLGGLQTGAAVRLAGLWRPSPAPGQPRELAVERLTVYGTPDPAAYPLQKKRHSFEFLREWTHLRGRTNTFGAIFRLRDRLAAAIHRYFRSQGFFWVHTPIVTTSDAEGAGQQFRVTAETMAGQEFFGLPAHLSVSGQLNAEALALALGRVYTFGPTFRAENSNTVRHLSEFWMVEPEAAFFELEDDMRLAQGLIQSLLRDALEECPEEMEFFDRWIQNGLIDQLRRVQEADFAHLTYTQAIEALEAAARGGKAFEFPVRWGMDLQSEHERYLTEEYIRGPVIVTDYPKDIKAFYMKQNPDGRTVRAMDVLVPRLGEIIGGSQREDDLQNLERRMTELGMNLQTYSWYLDLRRFGTTPHSGFGLGFERLLQYVTGMANIRDVIPFFRAPGQAPC